MGQIKAFKSHNSKPFVTIRWFAPDGTWGLVGPLNDLLGLSFFLATDRHHHLFFPLFLSFFFSFFFLGRIDFTSFFIYKAGQVSHSGTLVLGRRLFSLATTITFYRRLIFITTSLVSVSVSV
jgi:hypothetical protein